MNTQVEKLIKECDYLYGKIGNWRNYWNDVADFALPRKASINSPRLQGDRLRFNFLYDSTAITSLQVMSAGFHSNLTNPTSKWFAMTTKNPDFMDSYAVRMWFKFVEDLMFTTLNNSNFDTTMQEFYIDSGCFGTGTILCEEDWRDKVRFTSIPIEQVLITEDATGRVNKLRRVFKYTLEQAYSLFKERAGKTVMEKMEKNPYDEVEVIHYVSERERRDHRKQDSLNMPIESIWINKTDKVEMSRSGYMEFPFGVGRFYKDANDPYGYSPSMHALPWTKLLNAQSQTVLRAAMKQADPPMVAPATGFMLPFNLNPAYVNVYDSSKVADPNKAVMPLMNGGNIPITVEIMKLTQEQIEKAYFVPLFRSISDVTKEMTIPEVQRRIAENMVLLGPVVGRFTQEVIKPLLERTFKILYRRGEIPQPPEEIQDQELNFNFLGMLAKAQKQSEINSITNFLSITANVAAVIPSVLDKVDGDSVVDTIAQAEGIDPEMLNSDEKVEAIRTQRAQAEQAQMQLAMADQTAEVAKKATQAKKNDAGSNSKK